MRHVSNGTIWLDDGNMLHHVHPGVKHPGVKIRYQLRREQKRWAQKIMVGTKTITVGTKTVGEHLHCFHLHLCRFFPIVPPIEPCEHLHYFHSYLCPLWPLSKYVNIYTIFIYIIWSESLWSLWTLDIMSYQLCTGQRVGRKVIDKGPMVDTVGTNWE